ncbi:MAG: VIT and VWA domain-containing protein [Desulfovibrio sp.]|jgi:Ca-activated chloride channel family protein|nr:VIT and VWA domain-containing protein [Desulfovibrio sp.]
MRHDLERTGLASREGHALALQGVAIEGKVEGLLLSTTIRQTYRNDTSNALEVTYTFPLAWGTTLLGLDAIVGGKRLKGTVTPKEVAERDYEKAVEEGDLPVMVQESASGLMTANLGNIKSGETVELELRCGQLLRIEQGDVRICIPTVLAPRYGDAHGAGKLADHESDAVDMAAVYPLRIHIDVLGDMARAAIECPTHKVSVAGIEGGMAVDMEGGYLDRDFALLLRNLPAASFAMSCEDGKERMLVASFCPKLAQVKSPLLLKVLVDCSGSMSGDSIAEARKALHGVLQELGDGDYVSYSRFGSVCHHGTPAMQPYSEALLKELATAVSKTDADMGGTEMNGALASTIKDVALPKGTELEPCILLITDDLVWDESMLETAEKSGHRIFAVGVGSAPAQDILRRMTEKTGGACVFVPPNEDVVQAIVNMFHRMRGPRPPSMRVEWGGKPRWESDLPASVFDGDTVHVFATFPKAQDRVPRLVWEEDGKAHEVAPDMVVATDNPDVRRLGGWRKVISAKTPKQAEKLALEYQLVTRWTSLFLVHVREGEEKAEGLPTLHQVPNMLAAGTHGVGSVMADAPCIATKVMDFAVSMEKQRLAANDMRYISEACPGRASAASIAKSALSSVFASARPSNRRSEKAASFSVAPAETPMWQKAMLAALSRLAPHATDLADILDEIVAATAGTYVPMRIERLAMLTGHTETVLWAILLQWLMDEAGIGKTAQRHGRRLLRGALAGIDKNMAASLRQRVEQEFAGVDVSTLP